MFGFHAILIVGSYHNFVRDLINADLSIIDFSIALVVFITPYLVMEKINA